MINKEKVGQRFGKKSKNYDKNSEVQKYAAEMIGAYVSDHMEVKEKLSILEVGCGTGHLSEYLIQLFNNCSLNITDISFEMIDTCRAKIGIQEGVEFNILDAEKLDQKNEYDLIVSNFSIQWLNDINGTFKKFKKALKKGGKIIFTSPLDGSFDEWKEIVRELNLPFSAHELPMLKTLQNLFLSEESSFDYSLLEYQTNSSFRNFLKGMSEIGADSQSKNKELKLNEKKILLEFIQREKKKLRTFTYKIVLGCFSD